jgi:DNA polymerase-1
LGASSLLNRYPLSWKDLCRENGTENAYLIPLEEISRYCAEDAYECILLYDFFRPYLSKYYANRVYGIDTLNTITTGKLELEGIQIDKEQFERVLDTCDELISEYTDEFLNEVGNGVNLNSPQQISKLLFEELGVPTEGVKKGASGFYSTDKETLKELEGFHPIIDVIQNIGVCRKVKSLLLSGKKEDGGIANLVDDNWVLRPQTNNCLTVTGRFSMSLPNLQQSPNPSKYQALKNKRIAKLGKAFRDMFVPRKDSHWFLIADYPSFEFRILATLSKDPTLIQIFTEGLDFHVIICEKLFNVTYDKLNDLHRIYRQLTKTINYGVAYGMSWMKLQRECLKAGMNYDENKCRSILEDYWSVLHGVYGFFCREKLRAITKGYSQTMWGRKRFFNFVNYRLIEYKQNHLSRFDVDTASDRECVQQWEILANKNIFNYQDESNFRKVQNAPLQGTNADVMRYVLNTLDDDFTRLERVSNLYIRNVLTVHDEIVVESHFENIEVGKEIVKNRLENSIALSVPLPIDVKVVRSWGDAK